MHAVVFAKRIRHLTIDLDDHQFGALDHRPLPQIGGAKVEVAAIVHGAGFEDGNVHGIEKAAVIIRDLPEVKWRIVAAANVVLLPVIAGKMPTEHVEVLALGILTALPRFGHDTSVGDPDYTH